jgi:antitoxin HicB
MTKRLGLKDYLEMPWHFAVEPSNWEGEKGYWAWVCELPNCSTFGRSPSDALTAVAQSLPVYLEAAIDSKSSIPIPLGHEPEIEEVGGTIVLRLPKSLHIGLKKAAETENTSLNQFALYALTKMVYQTTGPSIGLSHEIKSQGRTKTAAAPIPKSTKTGKFLYPQPPSAARKGRAQALKRSKKASSRSNRTNAS